jgi:hypothetical protein
LITLCTKLISLLPSWFFVRAHFSTFFKSIYIFWQTLETKLQVFMTNLAKNTKLIDDASKLFCCLGNFDQWHVWTKVVHRKTNFMRINFEYNNLMRCRRKIYILFWTSIILSFLPYSSRIFFFSASTNCNFCMLNSYPSIPSSSKKLNIGFCYLFFKWLFPFLCTFHKDIETSLNQLM